MAQNLKLFVNYRRADHADFVGTIRTWFLHRYGRENVFMDFDTIPEFARFEDYIREKVRECDVLVAIIGPNWLDLLRKREESGKPDYFKAELEEALKHDKVIAPVCIKGAQVPPLDQIPESLHPIFSRQSARLRDQRDVLDRINGIMDNLEAELAQQGKQRQVKNPPTPEEQAEAAEPVGEFNIHEALDKYFEAKQTNNLPKALIWLARMRESGAMIPDFSIDREEADLQAQIKEEAEARQRHEVAEYLYGFVRVMARHNRDITKAMREVWKVEPGYDPDGLVVAHGKTTAIVYEGLLYTDLIYTDPILRIFSRSFEWLKIPAGQVALEDNAGTFDVQPILMAKCPTTYEQFQVFINDRWGFHNLVWWAGLSAANDYRKAPGSQRLTYTQNLPRENVSWYDAVAFCRWLSSQVGYEVRLPTEWEWQWAAQGPDGRAYPWGNDFDQSLCNTRESDLKKTTPVDNYPDGASPYGVLDMSGNVWEWCLNEYRNPKEVNINNNQRVVRGGSWDCTRDLARTACRIRGNPNFRLLNLGFRIVCDSHPDL